MFAHWPLWASLLLLAGCGFQTLGVKNLDTLLTLQASRKMDLHSKQKDAIEVDIDAFLRTQQAHAPILEQLLKEIDPANPELFEGQWKRAIAEYRRGARDASVVIARHLARLSVEQRLHFAKTLAQDNEKMAKKGFDRDQMEERVEWFLGEIRAPQQSAINTHLPVLQARRLVRLQLRQQLRERLVALLEGQAVDKEQLMIKAFAAYQQATTDDQGPVLAFYADLVRQLDDKQKRRFEERRGELLEFLKTFVATKY